MKEIAIFRHAASEGPGYLAEFLARRGRPHRLIRIDRHDPLPSSIAGFSALVFMGGPMSVNDDLPWIPPVLESIRRAVAADLPVLGHCLGGQLISKALGGGVTRNPVKEIGWLPVSRVNGPLDLLVDYGTLDDMRGGDRDLYVRNVLPLTHPASLFLLFCFEWPPRRWERYAPVGMALEPGEVVWRFGQYFEIERIAGTEQPDFSQVIAGTATYLMTRKGDAK